MAVHTAPRTHSARRTLVSLLLIPMLSLAGLWVFIASITFGNVINNEHYNTATNTIGPSIIGLEQTLETEGALTLTWLRYLACHHFEHRLRRRQAPHAGAVQRRLESQAQGVARARGA